MDQQDFWDDYQFLKKEVTKLRGSEARLQAIRARYAALSGLTDAAVLVMDRDGLLVEIGGASHELLGVDESAMAKRFRDLFTDSSALAVASIIEHSIQSLEPGEAVWLRRRSTGPALHLKVRCAPILDESNRAAGALVLIRDISDLTALDEDLDRMGEELALMKQRVRKALGN